MDQSQVVISLDGFEEVPNVVKSVSKNKKILLFAGLGVGAAVVVLAIRGARGEPVEEPVVTAAAERDQSVNVLGSQLEAFAKAVQDSQASITSQLEAASTEVSLVSESFLELQRTVSDNQASVVSQLVDLQRSQETAAQPSYSYNQPSYSQPSQSSSRSSEPEKVVYGKTADLTDDAKTAFGSGYKFVNIDNVDTSKLNLNSNSVALGGSAIWGNKDLNGATQLGGYDRYETAALVINYTNQ